MRKMSPIVALVLFAVVAAVLACLALWRSRPLGATPSQAAADQAPESVTVPSAFGDLATVAPSASRTPSTSALVRTLVVLGDSHAQDAAWATELGRLLNARVVNLSEAGLSYAADSVACTTKPCTSFGGKAKQVAAAKPDIILVEGGDADGDFNIKSQVAATLATLNSAVPKATIVTTSPLGSRSPRPYWLKLHFGSIAGASAASGDRWVDSSSVTGSAGAYSDAALTKEAAHDLAALLAKETFMTNHTTLTTDEKDDSRACS